MAEKQQSETADDSASSAGTAPEYGVDLLKQALTEGQISLIEYFVETESIYKNLQAYMQIENQYQKVMANIYKNNL